MMAHGRAGPGPRPAVRILAAPLIPRATLARAWARFLAWQQRLREPVHVEDVESELAQDQARAPPLPGIEGRAREAAARAVARLREARASPPATGPRP